MDLLPNAEDWRLARTVHERFKRRPGSAHIASVGALSHLAALLRTERIKSVLEFGSGIGTVSYLLLASPPKDRRVVSFERNPFCLSQLARNIPQELGARLTVHEEKTVPDDTFDLVVIDGSVADYSFLRNGQLLFVEGNRAKQRHVVERVAKERGFACSFHRYPVDGPVLRLKWRRLGAFPIPRLTLRFFCSIAKIGV
jgi:hypothetical protein